MAATPPGQIRTRIQTPPTPLHGAAYDSQDSPPRRSARLSQRLSRESYSQPENFHLTPRKGRSSGTPTGSRRTSQASPPDLRLANSPRSSPKHRPTRRVQVLSPSSPDFESSIPKPTASTHLQPTIFSATTTMSEGMLPTPIKTPKKKTIPKVNGAARALFVDQPILGEEVAPVKRARKQRRYNGFSLENFSANDPAQRGGIQIFTDSRDQIPVPVTSEGNPFVDTTEEDSTMHVAEGRGKRRKISGERKKDAQVQDAIDRDEGMVYVFRGKKLYRRFDDMDEEEEVIDTDDLGLLEHFSDGAERLPMKTLTRKSIKPRRLFETEEQKKARAAEKEREASTDVEDGGAKIFAPAQLDGAEVEIIDLITPADPGRTLRSPRKIATNPAGSKESVVEKVKEHHATNGSPFASWRRVKSSSGPSVPASGKGKRPATEMEEATSSKRLRGD